MFEVGDLVLHEVLVGVVIKVSDDKLVCSCSDYSEHEWAANTCTLITKYSDTLGSFERSIMNAHR